MSKNVAINDKIEELENDIEWFYGEDFSLDDAVSKYEKSIKLAKEIEEDLNKIKNKITVLNEDFSKS